MRDEDIDRRPTLIGVVASTFAAFAIGVMFAQYALVVVAPVTIGLVAIIIGGFRGMRTLAFFGITMLVISMIMAGLYNYPVSTLLAAGVLTVVAWDMLQNGFSIGQQVGREIDTTRVELLHGGTTLLSGTVVAALIYGIYVLSPPGWPLQALILAMLAALFLVIAIEL